MSDDAPAVRTDVAPPFRLEGSVLVTGPSNAGKTRLTAHALDRWLAANGRDGVVVLEFAPTIERGGRVLGGRLDRFTTVPDAAWHGVLDAHAPRAEADAAGCAEADTADHAEPDAGDTDAGADAADASAGADAGNAGVTALDLARENARTARAIVDAAPSPRAVFVNDATIPFQSGADPSLLTDYCDRAAVAVCNAFESDELGTDDPVSRNERAALAHLHAWTDEHVRLP